jgi:NTP pyrophosphatase (non-canonical NTP hydrolase)
MMAHSSTSPNQTDASAGACRADAARAGLQTMVARLFAPGGDVWSRERTIFDFGRYLVEEAGEVAEAIADMGNAPLPQRVVPRALSPHVIEHFKEELGDVFWNLLVLVHMAEQAGWFHESAMLEELIVKMEARNAPFFRGAALATAEAVDQYWAAEKARERTKTRGYITSCRIATWPDHRCPV